MKKNKECAIIEFRNKNVSSMDDYRNNGNNSAAGAGKCIDASDDCKQNAPHVASYIGFLRN
ncbi:MAG: hypothetical protein IKX20_06510 [Paludibacteraceae bacterium]|nr:hypothetical protein [Paludibacteraceae bacterium]